MSKELELYEELPLALVEIKVETNEDKLQKLREALYGHSSSPPRRATSKKDLSN